VSRLSLLSHSSRSQYQEAHVNCIRFLGCRCWTQGSNSRWRTRDH
jgi:hypothetical protein